MTTRTLTALLLALSVLQPAAAESMRLQERSGNVSPTRPDEVRPLLTNVQVELTVTDSMAGSGPQKKAVSMMIADGRMGRIRSIRDLTKSTAPLS